jgi:uncharacterized protein (DUF885 family)
MNTRFGRKILLLLGCLAAVPLLHADELDDLARDFWTWRAAEMPVTTDDIPRLERPAAWLPKWSPADVSGYRHDLEKFETRWKNIDVSHWPVPRQVDYRLMGSAIARVRWELEITRNWQRNPLFYNDQTIGAYYSLLLAPPPFDAARSRDVVQTLAAIPSILDDAKKNLSQPVAPFAQLAIDQLQEIRPAMLASIRELKPLLDPPRVRDLDSTAATALAALESYRDWLAQRLPSMPAQTAVGREGYIFFLKNVALLPYTPEQLLEIGRAEWARSVAFETYEEHRNLGLPELPIFKSQAQEIAQEANDEQTVRQYLERKDLLTVPAWARHYVDRPMPAYLAPLAELGAGEADDFTGPSRLDQDGIRYITDPGPKLGYFALASAKDPRPEIVHEGVPGHYFQLILSWKHPDPIRRHYYDSGANEGLGFYAEEMMEEAGLFDDRPRTREIICNFMRLRALRVEVDVKLALGEFSIAQAADYLQRTVPMDARTAHTEAAFFATGPGQAISYQIGKFQILKFLADARRQQGDKFSLRSFHDFLWLNGNVPIALQRWEYLGLDNELSGR